MTVKYVPIYIFAFLAIYLQNIGSIKLKYMVQERNILSNMEKHPCQRQCIKQETMTCTYKFIVEGFTSMGLQCKNCPYNISDCYRSGCITAGGVKRPVIAVNQQIPGPDIQVCEGDTVIVDVTNTLKTEGITIHWHGLHQHGTPYMDGTPYVTQCPILPYNTFRYQFTASPAGTHIWHGHVGFQDTDGLLGKLIVRRQESKEIKKFYDYDLPEHSILLLHWFNWLTQGIVETVLHTNGSIYGFGILVNGKGILKEYTSTVKSRGVSTVLQTKNIFTTRREVFYVKPGKRYVFRIISNSAIYCPIQVSVDEHVMEIFGTDTANIDPIEVDSFMITSGERYSFILSANYTSGCYWMRFRGIGDCGEKKLSVHQEAFLCYKGSKPNHEDDSPTYDEGKRSGILFNAMETVTTNYTNNTLQSLTDMKAATPQKTNIDGKPDVVLYVQLSDYLYDIDYPGAWPQFNNITFEYPELPLFAQRYELRSNNTCSREEAKKYCQGLYCTCPYVEELPLNALVEIVLIDITKYKHQDHPVHLHGHYFHIVALEGVGYDISYEGIMERNEKGHIKKKFLNVPTTDTLAVPNKGFAVLRLITYNPGYWLFHCHVSNHMELGMAVVLKIGNHSDMAPVPPGFPRCGNYIYKPQPSSSSSLNHICWIIMIVFYFIR